MTVLEVYDTVALRADPTLVGTVERTYANGVGWQEISLEDLLIVNYTDVPQSVLIDFITSRVPPRGFVFVICVDEEKGAFLASEDDLQLVSRSFDLGDVVKKHGQTSSMIGTIVNFADTYTLRPVFYETPDGRVKSLLDPIVKYHPRARHNGCEGVPADHDIIYNVPTEEIIHAQTILDGDIAIRDNWVGAIEASDFDIILLLANGSVAVLKNPADLHTPIRDPEKPIVSLPEFDLLARPAILSAFQGWSTIPALRTPRFGSFVVTSRKTLSKARWIRGQYTASQRDAGVVPPHAGTVIGVIPRTVEVKWITSTPFTQTDLRTLPSHRQTVFKTIESFTSEKDLRRKEGFKICDGASYPPARSTQLTTSDAPGSTVRGASFARHFGVLQDLRPGDQVRWRDPYGAAVKYAGKGACRHGAFNRINSDQYCPGWDINYLDIVSKTQNVTVQWQDGSETTHAASELFRFGAFETALVPGNIVVDRTGLQMAPADFTWAPCGPTGTATRSDFNEVAFFERRHDLFPSKVGIIQAIDHQERIAKVRWFLHPKVVLSEGGELLVPSSLFGALSDAVNEVSLYEIMTFPAFDWRTRDFAILPPNTTFEALEDAIRGKRAAAAFEVPLTGNLNLDLDRLIERGHTCRRNSEVTKQAVCVTDADSGDGAWLGEIIAIGLDGHFTVRMRDGKICRDVRIPLDVVLATMNVEETAAQEYDTEGTEEEWQNYDSGGEGYPGRSPSAISESIEYEGGARMDQDEDDEAWVSADEDVASSTVETTRPNLASSTDIVSSDLPGTVFRDEDVEMTDASTQTRVPHLPYSRETRLLRNAFTSTLPSKPPASFDVLSIPPSSDQFSVSLDPTTSPAFLKRISKEHQALSNSLPEGQIYVRTYESRLDLLRCLIIGPPDTPYEDAPFLVDLYLGRNFPEEPPVAHFHSWTSGLGRINPNLYEEGKICLSLLGTWPGKERGEGWSKDATILQVLVSLQGLVMVRNPFFNEAGFEGYEAEGGYKLEAAQYAEKAFVMARGFVKHALTQPPVGLGDVLDWIYASRDTVGAGDEMHRGLLKRVLDRGHSLIEKSEEARTSVNDLMDGSTDVQLMDARGNTGDAMKAFLRPLSKGAIVMLKRMLAELEIFLNGAKDLRSDCGGP